MLSNLKCEIQPTLINLNPNEYSQKFNYFLFVTKLDRYAGSCNTINNLSNKVYVPNKSEDLNLSMSNMITGTNESKALAKHISYECKCRFDERKYNSNQCEISVDVSVINMYVKKIMFRILLYIIVKIENI